MSKGVLLAVWPTVLVSFVCRFCVLVFISGACACVFNLFACIHCLFCFYLCSLHLSVYYFYQYSVPCKFAVFCTWLGFRKIWAVAPGPAESCSKLAPIVYCTDPFLRLSGAEPRGADHRIQCNFPQLFHQVLPAILHARAFGIQVGPFGLSEFNVHGPERCGAFFGADHCNPRFVYYNDGQGNTLEEFTAIFVHFE